MRTKTVLAGIELLAQDYLWARSRLSNDMSFSSVERQKAKQVFQRDFRMYWADELEIIKRQASADISLFNTWEARSSV